MYLSSCGTKFRFSVNRSLPSITTLPKIMISVAANIIPYSTIKTVGARSPKNQCLYTGLRNTSSGLQKLRIPSFPFLAESSIPFNIHRDSTNQPNSKVNDGAVNEIHFKSSCTHNGIRHSDPLQVPTQIFISPTSLTARWPNTR